MRGMYRKWMLQVKGSYRDRLKIALCKMEITQMDITSHCLQQHCEQLTRTFEVLVDEEKEILLEL